MSELVKSVSIANLLNQRNAVVERIHQACAVIDEAREIAVAARLTETLKYRGFDWIINGTGYHWSTTLLNDQQRPEITKRIDAAAWDYLMRESGLMTFMDSKARDEWAKQIEACNCPPLNEENIESTFRVMHDSRGEMFERGVIRCFKQLSWNYRTNVPAKFGKRIVKRLRSYGRFDHQLVAEVGDLQRVFRVMDGQPEEDHRNGLYHRLGAYDALRGDHDDTYMHFRWFKNGNSHITFKRADLVDRMNLILVKHFPDALPPAREAA